MASDTSKQCLLTNNSGKDVMISLPVLSNETAATGATLSANGQLEILKTADGNTVIKNNSSGTVTLDHTYKPGGDQNGYVQSYDLQIRDTAWFYPLAVLPVNQQTVNGAKTYGSQTISPDNTAMNQAFLFYQTISVYPDSGLAKDYTAALRGATDAAIAKANESSDAATAAAAMEETVNLFFKGTKEYGQVTLAHMVTADSYYKSFPAVWAQYKDSSTYYLYSSDGAKAGFAGTLMLEKTGAIDATKSNSGYACTFAPAVSATSGSTEVNNSKAVILSYVNGLFTDDPAATQPKISLKGSFINAGLLLGDDTNKNIITIVSGNINSVLCIGFSQPQKGNSTTPQPLAATQTTTLDNYWDTLLHPQNQRDLIVSIMTLAGAVLLIPALASAVYGIYRVIKYKAAVREALTKQIVEYTRDAYNQKAAQLSKEELTKWETQFGEWLGDYYVKFNPDNIEGYDRVLENHVLSNKLKRALEIQQDNLREALEFSSNMTADEVATLNTTLGKIRQANIALNESSPTELETVLPEQFTAYKQITTEVMNVYFNMEGKISSEVRTAIGENSDLSQQLYKEIESSFNGETGETVNKDPAAMDHLIPEEV